MYWLVDLLRTLDSEATKELLYTVDMVFKAAPASLWATAVESSALMAVMLNVIISDVSICEVHLLASAPMTC